MFWTQGFKSWVKGSFSEEKMGFTPSAVTFPSVPAAPSPSLPVLARTHPHSISPPPPLCVTPLPSNTLSLSLSLPTSVVPLPRRTLPPSIFSLSLPLAVLPLPSKSLSRYHPDGSGSLLERHKWKQSLALARSSSEGSLTDCVKTRGGGGREEREREREGSR